VFGTAVGRPLIRPLARQPALGGDNQLGWIGVQRFRDQVLGNMRTIGIGCIDEVDAEVNRRAQYGPRLLQVYRISPDPWTREAHGTEAETMNRQVASQKERFRRRRPNPRCPIHGTPIRLTRSQASPGVGLLDS